MPRRPGLAPERNSSTYLNGDAVGAAHTLHLQCRYTLAETLGLFEQAVLLAIAAPETRIGQKAYGRAVLKEVQHRLRKEVAASAVYATLARLEAKGLVSSRLGAGAEARAGRPRRFYRVEAAGVRALNQSKAAVDRVWAGVRVPLRGGS